LSTFDYAGLKADVDLLMTEFGRSITLRRTDRTPADAAQPWKGPSDPGTSVDVVLDAVFVPPNTVRQFGLTALGEGTEVVDLLRFSEQIVIVAQDIDLRDYDQVIDTVPYRIIGYQVLRPGDVYMLGFLGVRR